MGRLAIGAGLIQVGAVAVYQMTQPASAPPRPYPRSPATGTVNACGGLPREGRLLERQPKLGGLYGATNSRGASRGRLRRTNTTQSSTT